MDQTAIKIRTRRQRISKRERQRFRKRRDLLQSEFNKECFDAIVTYKDVVGLIPVKKENKKLRIVSSIVLSENINYKEIIKPRKATPPPTEGKTASSPPLICLVTPPHPGVSKTVDPNKFRRENKQKVSDATTEKKILHFPPGKRVASAQNRDSHPTLYCKGCSLKPVNIYCINFFEKNYFVYIKDKKDKFYKNIQLRDELRDLFGESDISD